MDGIKNYIVNYNIRANVSEAITQLETMARSVNAMQPEITKLTNSIGTISKAINELKANSKFVFEPTIAIQPFFRQLDTMLIETRKTAAQMRLAISEAFAGHGVDPKLMQQKATAALTRPMTSASIKQDIAAYGKELDKLLGPIVKGKGNKAIRDSRKGAIQATQATLDKAIKEGDGKAENEMRKRLDKYKSDEKLFKGLIKERQSMLATAQQLEKEPAAKQTKAVSSTGVVTSSQPKVTNVTPETIKAWKKAFGNARSRSITLSLLGKATGSNGAMTVIQQVSEKLEALKGMGEFMITPILNNEAFAQSEAKLQSLAGLSAAIVKPFQPAAANNKTGLIPTLSQKELKQLATAQNQVKAWNEKIAPVQQRLDKNQAIPEDKRTPAVKGQITKDTKTLASYNASKAPYEKTVEKLQGKTNKAITSSFKGIKPITLDIIGNLSRINLSATVPEVGVVGKLTKIEGLVAQELPVNVKITRTQITKTLKAITPPPVLDVKVNLLTNGVQQQLQTLSTQLKPVAGNTGKDKGTKGQGKNAGGKVNVAGTVDTKGIISQIKAIPKQTIPLAMKLTWANGAVGRQAQLKSISEKLPPIPLQLNIEPAIAKLDEFIALVKSKSPQTIALTATGAAGATGAAAGAAAVGAAATKTQSMAAVPTAKPAATGGTTQPSKPQTGHTGHQPLTPQQQRAKELAAMRKDATAAFSKTTSSVAPSGFMGSGTNRVFFGDQKPSAALALNGYHWERTNSLGTRLNGPEAAGMTKAIAAQEKAAENVRSIFKATQPLISQAKNPTSPYLDKLNTLYGQARQHTEGLRAQWRDANNKLASYQGQAANLRAQQGPLEAERKALLAKKSLNPNEAARLTQISNSLRWLSDSQNAIAQQQAVVAKAANAVSVAGRRQGALAQKLADTREETRTTMLQQPMDQRRAAVEEYGRAKRVARGYTSGYQLTPDEGRKNARSAATAKPGRGNAIKAERLRAQAQNAMLPFAQNQQQLNLLTNYRHFFKQAQATTGIIPTPGMNAQQMLPYLQGVSTQMQKANVAVPWQLQNQINKLQAQVAKQNAVPAPARGVRAPGYYASPTIDRMRRWSYPLTGSTSFGMRTPMAVDMAKGMGVMFAIGGAMSAISNSFGQAMEYQNTMRTTQAILQNGTDTYNQSDFKNMEGIVRDVGVKTKFSAPEVADAAKFLAMAGYDIDAINASIRPIADLALIGDTDLGETADKLTNIMTTFHIAPERMREVANIMATTATRTNTDLMMLAESAKYGGGVAQMYNGNDKYLFGDTMALFGVMGNSGVQASSAGTSLRMMYQNIFNPNKKQAAILQHLQDKYGITTITTDGGKRSMADIIIDMANKVDAKELPDIIGKLFRITAQPGANAALTSAMDIAMEGANGDQNAAMGLVEETNALVDKLSGKNGAKTISTLAKLIQANRDSIDSNISGAIAEEKQNTISGLWAQVTSTFTEGIVKAFENRQGGFEGMLKALRDYMAKPETVQMLQNLLDLVIEIGKVMAWFVKIWATMYNAAPSIIKTWIVLQMCFTQVGALVRPFMQLIEVFGNLRKSTLVFTGASTASSMAMRRNAVGMAATSGVSNAAMLTAPFVTGTSKRGMKRYITGNAAVRANMAMKQNAILAGELALAGAARGDILKDLNKETRQHYDAVRQRANRMYGRRAVGRAFMRSFTAVPTMASFAPMLGGLKSMLMGLLTGLAKVLGFLLNPITLAIGAIGALTAGIVWLTKVTNGSTEAQRIAREKMNRAADQTSRQVYKDNQWYRNLQDSYGNIKKAQVIHTGNPERVRQLEAEQQEFRQRYGLLFEDLTTHASKQSVEDVARKWKQTVDANPAYKLAMGAHYDEYAGKNLGKMDEKERFSAVSALSAKYTGNATQTDYFGAEKMTAQMLRGALMTEATHNPEVKKAIAEITALRNKYLDTREKIDKQAKGFISPLRTDSKLATDEYQKEKKETTEILAQRNYTNEALKIKQRVLNTFPKNPLSAAGLTIEQYRQSDDRSRYDLYQEGAMNLIDAYINAQDNTVTAMLDEQRSLGGKIKMTQEQWYRHIANVIGNYHVFDEFVSEDGKQKANIELMINMLPNNTVDFSFIKYQVEEKIGKFQESLRQYADIMTTVYKMMMEAGDMKYMEAVKLIKGNVKHRTISEQDARDYYYNHVAQNKKNLFYQSNMQMEDFVKFVTSQDESDVRVMKNGSRFSPARARVQIREAIARDEIKKIGVRPTPSGTMDAIEQENNKSGANGSQTGTVAANSTVASSSSSSSSTASSSSSSSSAASTPKAAGSQDAYASHYNKSAAHPTQVVFNIQNLASFDKTTIASNAEERDLIAAMEEKIVGAVYQLFAEASNQAQRVMNMA